MNRTEKSRENRKKKNTRTTIIFGLGLVLIIAIISLIVKSVFFDNKTSSQDKKPDNQVTETGLNSEGDSEKTEDRAKVEEDRKEKYGKFYVPLPAQDPKIEAKTIKSLYLNHNNIGLGFEEENIKKYEEYVKYVLGEAESYPDGAEDVNVLEKMLALCNATEANAIVVDIKTDDGILTWQSDIEIVNELDTDAGSDIFNYEKLISYMKDHDIRPIARIVTFKDTFLAQASPEHTMKDDKGDPFVDGSGASWVDQTDEFVWSYVLSIAKETALRGFEEIHFDYIRYPEATSEHAQLDDNGQPVNRDDVISNFLEYAREELDPYGVQVASAVFGIITSTWEDEPEDIGQTWIKITDNVDAISPMIYPSHYSTGWYGFEVPDYEPYGVFHQAMEDAYEKNSSVKNPGTIRPWIQGFTADYMDDFAEYDGKMIADQVKASYEYGIEGYLIWNALNEYDPEIFKYTQSFEPKAEIKFEDFPEYSYHDILAEESDQVYPVVDILDRSPYDLARMYLDSHSNDNSGRIYLITSKESRVDGFDKFFEKEYKQMDFDHYEIIDVVKEDKSFIFTIGLSKDEQTKNIELEIILEDQMFKVKSLDELSKAKPGQVNA